MNRSDFSRLRYGLALVLCLTLIFSASCRLNANPEYPVIPEAAAESRFGVSIIPTKLPVNPEPTIETSPASKITLKVAGPWSASDLDLLGKYYAMLQEDSKSTDGAWPGGDQISFAAIADTEPLINFSSIPISIQEGLTDDLARRWTATSNWPDIVMTRSIDQEQAMSHFSDLTPLLIDNPDLSSDKANANLIKLCQSGKGFYHLPWRVTLPVLYYNRNLLKAASVDEPAGSMSWTSFNNLIDQLVQKYRQDGRLLNASLLGQISKANNRLQISEQAVLLFANPQALIDYIPAAETTNLGWSTWDGRHFNFEHPSFAAGVDQVRELVQKGAWINPLDQAFSDQFGSIKKMIDNGQVVFWIGDSSEMYSVPDDRVSSVGYTLLPFGQTERIVRLPARLLTLSVSQASPYRAMAAQFAAFLSFDSDALQIQSRLMSQEGLFPAVSDSRVWETLLEQQKGGKGLSELPTILPYVYTGGQYEHPNWDSLLAQTIDAFSDKLLTSTNPQREIKQMQLLADQLTE